jgi:hypothetical protein
MTTLRNILTEMIHDNEDDYHDEDLDDEDQFNRGLFDNEDDEDNDDYDDDGEDDEEQLSRGLFDDDEIEDIDY